MSCSSGIQEQEPQPAGEVISAVARHGMRVAIIGSCFKVLSSSVFTNGLMLIYLTALKLPGTTVLLLLSLSSGLQALALIPCAHLADVYGKRRLSLWGIAVCGIGFCLIPLAAGVLSAYDAVLMVFAVLIVLMTVTLGLIPSVLGRPDLRGSTVV